MKVALLGCAAVALVVGCGGGGGSDTPSNTAGGTAGGAGSSAAGAGAGGSSAGMTTGGSLGQSGGSGGGASGSAAGGASAVAGTGGTSGGSGGGNQAFSCPAGAVDAPELAGLAVVRVQGVPPADAFNDMNNQDTNIEGPVWLGDALYMSEINYGGGQSPPPSRVLKVTAAGQVSVAIPSDSGSNGLAINAAGELFGALHLDGSVSKLSLTGGAAVPVVSMFMGQRFGSPNDLTFHSNGTMYFSDPSWQAPNPNPQSATRAYRVPAGGQPVAIEELNQPNGMTLSKNQDVLYIGGNQLKKYPVMPDGTLGTGTVFVQGGGSDGMVIDCADNLYTTGSGVTVYSPAGMEIGKISVNGISSVTNVAFGGADHKTLYITSMGNKEQKGLWQVPMNVQGMPY